MRPAPAPAALAGARAGRRRARGHPARLPGGKPRLPRARAHVPEPRHGHPVLAAWHQALQAPARVPPRSPGLRLTRPCPRGLCPAPTTEPASVFTAPLWCVSPSCVGMGTERRPGHRWDSWLQTAERPRLKRGGGRAHGKNRWADGRTSGVTQSRGSGRPTPQATDSTDQMYASPPESSTALTSKRGVTRRRESPEGLLC